MRSAGCQRGRADLAFEDAELVIEGEYLGAEPHVGASADDQDLEQETDGGVGEGAEHDRRVPAGLTSVGPVGPGGGGDVAAALVTREAFTRESHLIWQGPLPEGSGSQHDAPASFTMRCKTGLSSFSTVWMSSLWTTMRSNVSW